MSVKLETVNYKHFGECVRLSNDSCELLVLVGCGPRVIRFALHNGENVFAELKDEGFETENGLWRIRGGHRLWHSPESMPRTYSLDNDAVPWVRLDGGVRTTQKAGADFMIKEMDITLDAQNPEVKIVHRIYNASLWPVEFAVWALSVMAPGGVAIVPQNRTDTGLLPNRSLVFWPYTDVRDERAWLGNRFILVRQDKGASPFMFGQPNESGWAGYAVNHTLFVKRFVYEKDAAYPDFGCSFESYCCDFMLELEGLSPLRTLAPGAFSEYEERWRLWDGIQPPKNESEAIQIYDMITL